MTHIAKNDITLAGRPIHCSACFGSYPIPHVDFDAECDRGYGETGAVQITLDDLILCANCVKEGAALLGMIDGEETTSRITDLETKLDEEHKRRQKAERYADTLEDGLTRQRTEPVHIDHRQKPRKAAA